MKNILIFLPHLDGKFQYLKIYLNKPKTWLEIKHIQVDYDNDIDDDDGDDDANDDSDNDNAATDDDNYDNGSGNFVGVFMMMMMTIETLTSTLLREAPRVQCKPLCY